MTHDLIDRMIRQANPVPDPTALEPVEASVLMLEQQRRTEMQTHDRVEVDQGKEKPRRGLLIGIAAAAAIAIGALILMQTSEEPEVVDQPSTPIETATAFVEAYAGFDTEAAASYLSDEAQVSLFQNTGEDWQTGSAFMEATGFELIPGQCEQVSTTTSQTTVRCPFDYHALRSEQLGRGPYTDNSITLKVEGGEIVAASMVFAYEDNGFSTQMWEPFAAWIQENHPEDIPVMYELADQSLESHSEESTALWAQRTEEWVEALNAGAAG